MLKLNKPIQTQVRKFQNPQSLWNILKYYEEDFCFRKKKLHTDPKKSQVGGRCKLSQEDDVVRCSEEQVELFERLKREQKIIETRQIEGRFHC